MKPIKLVVSDIDGTLIRRGEAFPRAVIRSVERLRENGIGFTFASGRLPYMINPYLEQLKLADVPVCACNGTLLVKGSERLESHPMAIARLRPLIEDACRLGMTVLYALEGEEYCIEENAVTRRKTLERGSYHEIRPIAEDEWERLLVDKVNILDEESRMPILEPLERAVDDICDITHYGREGLEIVASGYGKEYGIKRLAEYMGISTDEILAIGDNENDMAMVRFAGVGGVVANGTDEVKACADFVAEKESGDGVAELIERVCFGGNCGNDGK